MLVKSKCKNKGKKKVKKESTVNLRINNSNLGKDRRRLFEGGGGGVRLFNFSQIVALRDHVSDTSSVH